MRNRTRDELPSIAYASEREIHVLGTGAAGIPRGDGGECRPILERSAGTRDQQSEKRLAASTMPAPHITYSSVALVQLSPMSSIPK